MKFPCKIFWILSPANNFLSQKTFHFPLKSSSFPRMNNVTKYKDSLVLSNFHILRGFRKSRRLFSFARSFFPSSSFFRPKYKARKAGKQKISNGWSEEKRNSCKFMQKVENCDVNECWFLFIELCTFLPCYLIGLWFFNGSLNLSRAFPRASRSCRSPRTPESGFKIIYASST